MSVDENEIEMKWFLSKKILINEPGFSAMTFFPLASTIRPTSPQHVHKHEQLSACGR
jgi:hypothetical protein